MTHQLRIARPTADVDGRASMYCRGLKLSVLASFRDHDGFDGAMVGVPGAAYHLEFTRHRRHPVTPTPTREDILVFYYTSEPEWSVACERMRQAGFQPVTPSNPYWSVRGRSFQDPDGYLVVLQQETWISTLERE